MISILFVAPLEHVRLRSVEPIGLCKYPPKGHLTYPDSDNNDKGDENVGT